MGALMKQAQQFQERLRSIQEELATKTVTGSAGGGMVTATVNGRCELVAIAIEPGMVNAAEVHLLQDLILAAVNDGLRQARQMAQGELGRLTGGLQIPGLV